MLRAFRRLAGRAPALTLVLCTLAGMLLGLVFGVVALYATAANAQQVPTGADAAIVETGKAAGMVLVKESILGAIAIVAILIAAGSVIFTLKVTKTSNDDRVKDKDKAADDIQKSTVLWRGDLTTLGTSVGRLATVVEQQTLQVTTAMRTNEENTRTTQRALDDMTRSVNELLRELARFMARQGGLSGRYQAARPRRRDDDPPKEDE